MDQTDFADHDDLAAPSAEAHRSATELANDTFDVAIIGGGILGAGIARDATLRGLRVALVEQNDFASGTSSRSTKLIHGGLRYLEQYDFRLVAEACRERSLLLDLAPHLVHPLSFLLPAYEGDPRSLWMLRVGTTLYDWLVPHRHLKTPRHRTLSAEEAIAHEPCLSTEGLSGAVLFYDCQMDDARLCLETILDANRRGATCVNYCRLTGFRKVWDKIETAQVADVLTRDSFDLRAKLFVNAAGPWVEQVAGLAAARDHELSLSPTKGVHLLLPRINHQHGIYFQSLRDRRMIFLLPWDALSLLGTTDTDYRGDPADARCALPDIQYLLGQLHELAPQIAVKQADLVTSFAGVRPLLRDPRRPSSRSREEHIAFQGTNLLSVAGGKYTTFRRIAERAVDKLCGKLDRGTPPCQTAVTPLEDLRPTPAGIELSSTPSVYESDIAHACRHELAVTLCDVMRRRTRLALSQHGTAEVASTVSHLMARALRWSETQRERNLRQYVAEWNRNRPWTE